MGILRFDNVSKRYARGQDALSEVSFAVEPGEMLFITGHSGAGKSTLLKLIQLAERPSRGAVLFDDKNLLKVRGRKASLEAIANKLGELGGNYDNSTVFICHGDCIEDAKYVENILKTKYGVKEVLINYTGAVIGSHSGPGTMAVFFLGDHR